MNKTRTIVEIGFAAQKIQKTQSMTEVVLNSAMKAVEETQIRGKPLSSMVGAISGSTQSINRVGASLQQKIYDEEDSVRSLASQLIVILTR